MEEFVIGRRRKKVTKIPRRTLPKIFQCPKCGNKGIGITIKNNKALVQCGNCNLKEEIESTPSDEPVDVYCKFIDHFYRGESTD